MGVLGSEAANVNLVRGGGVGRWGTVALVGVVSRSLSSLELTSLMLLSSSKWCHGMLLLLGLLV